MFPLRSSAGLTARRRCRATSSCLRTDVVGAPIVADLDGDGSAEILAIGHVPGDTLSGEHHLHVYGAASGRWARTRRAWLGELCDITSVDEQGG